MNTEPQAIADVLLRIAVSVGLTGSITGSPVGGGEESRPPESVPIEHFPFREAVEWGWHTPMASRRRAGCRSARPANCRGVGAGLGALKEDKSID